MISGLSFFLRKSDSNNLQASAIKPFFRASEAALPVSLLTVPFSLIGQSAWSDV